MPRRRPPAHLVLADGTAFAGVAIGAEGTAVGEVVFTTGMTGYQEVLTDPSYCGQIVTMTAPQIGNTGVNPEDDEARAPFLAGFVVHEISEMVSNWRAKESLDAYLVKHGIVGIAAVDTRGLTRHIRDSGAQMAAIGTEDVATLCDRARAAPPMTGRDLTGEVSTREPYEWTSGSGAWLERSRPARASRDLHVVAVDFGVKRSILRCLVDAGCRVTVVPATTGADAILALGPDGIFLSNGPGDPAAVTHGIATTRALIGKRPLFGICLGHQILALALGGSTYKLKFGHRGLNQPVKDLGTGRVEITTQNHGFCVDISSLAGKCETTHVHLNDGTVEGLVHRESGAFSVQYHPEAAAGPHDARHLFRRFTDAIERGALAA
jgi:carbamoyl-phosphate synthase small subunit